MGKRRKRMVSRQHEEDDIPTSGLGYDSGQRYNWIVYAVAALAVGGLMGYVLASQETRATGSVAAPSSAQTSSSATAPGLDEGALRAYRDILARDPKNLQAAVSAANLLYDAQRYGEAIPLYQQAFTLNPSDINVSTDLGTALWYAGRPDEALAQYEQSLALNATHAQTLFNVGIVKSQGKRDYVGAIAAWQKLLASNPSYPDVAKVRSLIADAQQKAGTPLPTRTGA